MASADPGPFGDLLAGEVGKGLQVEVKLLPIARLIVLAGDLIQVLSRRHGLAFSQNNNALTVTTKLPPMLFPAGSKSSGGDADVGFG